MRACALGCLALFAAGPLLAKEPSLSIQLLPGHPVHHPASGEAGAVMAIAIGQGDSPTDLQALCEELRIAADLALALESGLRLEVLFVVPWKGLAVEGYYLPALDTAAQAAPAPDSVGQEQLLPGQPVQRSILNGIVARAGVPQAILDETAVEHEISCELDRPSWLIRWTDVRALEELTANEVIERAYARFEAVYETVVAHAARLQ